MVPTHSMANRQAQIPPARLDAAAILDGPAHEIIRRNEELYCYQPEVTSPNQKLLHFLQRLCAAIGSGLLLRAKVSNRRNLQPKSQPLPLGSFGFQPIFGQAVFGQPGLLDP